MTPKDRLLQAFRPYTHHSAPTESNIRDYTKATARSDMWPSYNDRCAETLDKEPPLRMLKGTDIAMTMAILAAWDLKPTLVVADIVSYFRRFAVGIARAMLQGLITAYGATLSAVLDFGGADAPLFTGRFSNAFTFILNIMLKEHIEETLGLLSEAHAAKIRAFITARSARFGPSSIHSTPAHSACLGGRTRNQKSHIHPAHNTVEYTVTKTKTTFFVFHTYQNPVFSYKKRAKGFLYDWGNPPTGIELKTAFLHT